MPRAISKLGVQPVVYLNGVRNSWLRCVSVSRRAGGEEMDTAVIDVDLSDTDLLHDQQLRDLARPLPIEITLNNRVIHWGMVANLAWSLGGRPSVQFVSRLDKQHMGRPLYAWYTLRRLYGATDEVAVQEELVFNPLIDGVIVSNRLAQTARPKRDEHRGGFLYPLHPEALRTDAAKRWHSGGAPRHVEAWDIPTVVEYLCKTLNPFETYVKNPALGAVAAAAGDQAVDAEVVKNLRIPLGLYLNEALDRVLEPLDYGWGIEYGARGVRTIRVYRRGRGREVVLKHQRDGATLDVALSDTPRVEVRIDCSSRRSDQFRILGEMEEIEATFVLSRGWDEDYDGLAQTSLAWEHADWTAHPEYRHVWRKWVLNEAGDYIGTRAEITAPYDLSELFADGTFTPHRRRFHPTLTLLDGEPAGKYNGIEIEVSTDGGTTWVALGRLKTPGGVQVLADECGIYLTGQFPPAQLRRAGANAKLRVTATLRGDVRIGTALFAKNRFGGPKIETVINADARFRKRRVHSSSVFYDRLQSGELRAAESDDSAAVRALAKQLFATWNRADLSGSATLDGLDFTGNIGDVVVGIDGRNIGFEVNAPHDPRRYPEIEGVDYNILDQSVTVHFPSRRPKRIALPSRKEFFDA